MNERDANLATLADLIDAPCLGVVPWRDGTTPEQVAEDLNLGLLLDAVQRQTAT